jgi:hypothetical protein
MRSLEKWLFLRRIKHCRVVAAVNGQCRRSHFIEGQATKYYGGLFNAGQARVVGMDGGGTSTLQDAFPESLKSRL